MMAKKYFQRALSVGLSLALCAGLAAPAFAASFSELNDAINSTENKTFGENNDITASTDENGVRNVTLNGNVTNSGNEGSIKIGSDQKVNLDLNGYNIDNCSGRDQWSTVQSTIWVDGGTLTLDDHSNDTDPDAKVGVITGGTASGIWVEKGGKLIMNDGEISDNTGGPHGGGVYVKGAQSEFTMNGGTITDNTAENQGGGVHVQEGTFNMNGGEISNNTAQWGGGVNTYNGTINMSNGTIGGNTAKGNGSEVWVKAEGSGSNASFTMSGNSTIDGSAAKDGQHVVVVENKGGASSTFAMKDNATVESSGNAAADILAKAGSTVNYDRNDNGGLRDITADEEELAKKVNVDDTNTELDVVYPVPVEPENPVVDPADPVEVTIDEPAVPLAAGPVTRAEFIDYLWRHEDAPESAGVCTFTDVSADHDFVLALAWAEQNGVAEANEDGAFEPDELVTVADVREFLGNFARVFNMDVDVYALTTLTDDEDEAVLNCDEVLAEFFGEGQAE